jgi:hypothetical protein
MVSGGASAYGEVSWVALGPGRRAVCHDARVELSSARACACPLSPFAPPFSGLRHPGGGLLPAQGLTLGVGVSVSPSCRAILQLAPPDME